MPLFKNVWRRILTFFIQSKLWFYLARGPIAHLTFRVWGYPKFAPSDYFKIKNIFMKDTKSIYAFVSVDQESMSWKLNHLVSRCKWSHAGFVELGSDGELRISHMMGPGLCDWYLVDLLREVDHFALIKLPVDNISKVRSRINAVKLAASESMVEYDFSLSLDKHTVEALDALASQPLIKSKDKLKLYCAEYVYVGTIGHVPEGRFNPSVVLDHEAVEPDDVYRCGDVVYEN